MNGILHLKSFGSEDSRLVLIKSLTRELACDSPNAARAFCTSYILPGLLLRRPSSVAWAAIYALDG